MRDYTKLPSEAFKKELRKYALSHADPGGDLCYSALVRINDLDTKIKDLTDKIREIEGHGENDLK